MHLLLASFSGVMLGFMMPSRAEDEWMRKKHPESWFIQFYYSEKPSPPALILRLVPALLLIAFLGQRGFIYFLGGPVDGLPLPGLFFLMLATYYLGAGCRRAVFVRLTGRSSDVEEGSAGN